MVIVFLYLDYVTQLTLINEAFCQNIFALEPSKQQKSNFVQKTSPIGFEMTEKKMFKQTNKHFCISSRDRVWLLWLLYDDIKRREGDVEKWSEENVIHNEGKT